MGSMMEFIRRMIAETLQMEVCDESALAGLALWHHCGDAKGSSQNFASLMSQIKAGSPAHVWPCPWVANVGSCPDILEDERRNCVGFPGATLPPCNEIATTPTTTTIPKCCESTWQTPARTQRARDAMANKNPGSTPGVNPWNCSAYPQPIQILTDPATGAFTNVSTLNVLTGEYNLLFQIPTSATSPPMQKKFNSAAINPVDGISYATVQIGNVSYIIRFDDQISIAFVAKLPPRGDFSGDHSEDGDGFYQGAFDWAGTYYFGAHKILIAVKDIALLTGFPSQDNSDLTALTTSSSQLSYVRYHDYNHDGWLSRCLCGWVIHAGQKL